jgi:hypothetical protein
MKTTPATLLLLLAAASWVSTAGSATAAGSAGTPAADETVAACPLHAAHMAAAKAANAANAAAEDPAAARRELDARGDRHMGFRQDLTSHHFRLAADGGAVEVTARDPGDDASVRAVRVHLSALAKAFAAGDFSIPAAVHARVPPGVGALRAAGAEVAYEFAELPAGGVVRMTAGTPDGLAAVHEFLRFQIADHGTGDANHVH